MREQQYRETTVRETTCRGRDEASPTCRSASRSPFDRLIAAQCLRYDLTLVSIDEAFDGYGVRRIW